jgi:hypothetical protein
VDAPIVASGRGRAKRTAKRLVRFNMPAQTAAHVPSLQSAGSDPNDVALHRAVFCKTAVFPGPILEAPTGNRRSPGIDRWNDAFRNGGRINSGISTRRHKMQTEHVRDLRLFVTPGDERFVARPLLEAPVVKANSKPCTRAQRQPVLGHAASPELPGRRGRIRSPKAPSTQRRAAADPCEPFQAPVAGPGTRPPRADSAGPFRQVVAAAELVVTSGAHRNVWWRRLDPSETVTQARATRPHREHEGLSLLGVRLEASRSRGIQGPKSLRAQAC